MPEYVPGQRYPMTGEQARTLMALGWPAVSGEPDVGRGRRFLRAPCSWEFWTTDGRKVTFEHAPGVAFVMGQGREPDPDRPPPLED